MKKISDLPPLPKNITCNHPNHDPPNMIVLEPGVYEHECPSCGNKRRIVVPHGPRLDIDAGEAVNLC